MTAVSKDVYMNKSDDIVDEYNSTYHRTIKIKPFDVKDNAIMHILTIVKKLTLKILNLRNSKFKNTFAKGCTPNWSEEVFIIKKVQNTVQWTHVINDLNGEEIIGTIYETELQKANQQKVRIEKVIKKKDDKLYVK